MPLGTDVLSAGHCCTDNLGYHWQVSVDGTDVPYAVICDCPPFAGDPLTPLQEVTSTVSHELVESATDPLLGSDAAYHQTDEDHIIWTAITGGEISDMCEYNLDSNVTPAGSTYLVQRSWSNAAAKAGKNPCVPAPSAPYFNSIPLLAPVIYGHFGSFFLTQGVTIPVGGQATIDVELYSEAPTAGPWTIEAEDIHSLLGNGSPNLALALDKTSGVGGDVVKLTITVLADDPNFGGEAFVIKSDLDGQQNLSFGVVVN
jgi:hypothetical protein